MQREASWARRESSFFAFFPEATYLGCPAAVCDTPSQLFRRQWIVGFVQLDRSANRCGSVKGSLTDLDHVEVTILCCSLARKVVATYALKTSPDSNLKGRMSVFGPPLTRP